MKVFVPALSSTSIFWQETDFEYVLVPEIDDKVEKTTAAYIGCNTLIFAWRQFAWLYEPKVVIMSLQKGKSKKNV